MNLNISALSEEEKLFASKMKDVFLNVQRKNVSKYTSFLNERQRAICEAISEMHRGTNCKFSGGYEGAQRVMLCVMADYEDEENLFFPILPITFSYRKQDKLSHRDFLGALMNLMINRDQIGDILTEEGKAVVFVTKNVSELVLGEISKVGRVGVTATAGADTLPQTEDFTIITDTVPSLRLDCIVSVGFNISREKATAMIKSGQVLINSFVNTNNSYILKSGEKISSKGFGKFIFDEIGGQSKKGRTYIKIKKYI